MHPRKITGLFLALASLQPLQVTVTNVMAMAGGDWSGIGSGGAAALTGLVVFIVAFIGVIGVLTLFVAARYLRGARSRHAGVLILTANVLIAAIALREGSAGIGLWLWGAYGIMLLLAALFLLLPDRQQQEAAPLV